MKQLSTWLPEWTISSKREIAFSGGAESTTFGSEDFASRQWEQSAADTKALREEYKDCLASDEDEKYRRYWKGIARSYEGSALESQNSGNWMNF